MRLFSLWLAVGLCLVLAGCHRLTLRWDAGSCLNPPRGYCNARGTDSIALQVAIYQLRRPPDPESLRWEDFLEEGRDLEVLKGVLADPLQPERMRKTFTALRQGRAEERLKRHPRTRYLLLVAVGRRAGKASMVIRRVHRLEQDLAVHLELYDILTSPPSKAHVPDLMGGR